MYKRVKKVKRGRKVAHRESLRRNLLRSLFEKNSLVTTTLRAKVLKNDAMSLISKGVKGNTLDFTRELVNVFGNKELVKKFNEYVKKEEVGVEIVKIGFRSGDNAEKSRVILKGTQKNKKIVKKEKEHDVEEKKEEKKNVNVRKVDNNKKVDKTAVIKKTARANTRSGL